MPAGRRGHHHHHHQVGRVERVPRCRGGREVFPENYYHGGDSGGESSDKKEQWNYYYDGGHHHRSSRRRHREGDRVQRGKHDQWWRGEGHSSDAGSDANSFDSPRESGHHHRRIRQRRELSQTRRHRHRDCSLSSSSERDSRHRPKQQQMRRRHHHHHHQHLQRKEEETRATKERSCHGDGVENCSTSRGSPHQQLLSALDQQLAVYRRDSSSGTREPLMQTTMTASQGNSRTASSSSSSSRIVLHGVDLGVQRCHLNSMLEQLVGRRPLNVFRPAAELLESICNTAQTKPEASSEATSAAAVPNSCLHLGLHDASGAGGVVMIELAQNADAAAAVAVLNGAYVNGNLITAMVSC